ncbi:MAG: hypothetical protein CMP21_02400 [Rickettsiales bacterium]|nr:hypothetical protein [Rickettsiales bacterium]|tara:strand:+ start:27314 stop:27550 length:237 start_codon:yes stop_codon:yes gene_type:complete
MDDSYNHINKLQSKSKKKKSSVITVKIYDLNSVRDITIDLNNGKDRSKLKHIIMHEGHRLRKRDKYRYTMLLEKTKLS